MAGKRRGTSDDRGKLVEQFVRIVSEIRPKAFVIENVMGLASIHEGRLLQRVLRELRALNYAVAEPARLNAADFGVPQVRRRLFLVGLLGDTPFEAPDPTHAPTAAVDALAFGYARPPQGHVTVDEAIADLPGNGRSPDSVDVGDEDAIPYASVARSQYQERMRDGKQKVTGNRISAHMPHILEAISVLALPFGAVEPSTRYRRLYPDRPAFTLLAGSGSFTALRPIHPYRPRVITVREAARLQSFPDRIEFSSVKKWAYQSIGNSVPPLLGQALGLRLREFLE
jgi:DNA (cytosine-5)-methyltransferase 1